MRILYGLGNAGTRYADHRHNAGRMLVERFASDQHLNLDQSEPGLRYTRSSFHDEDLVVAVPDTYINKSGEGFRTLMTKYQQSTSFQSFLVVYDDLDLEVGTLRFRTSGGDGGHRGMRSILSEADTNEVPRLRIGIGRPPSRMDASDYVLQPFTEEQKSIMEKTFDRGCEALDVWLKDGLRTAMNQFNE